MKIIRYGACDDIDVQFLDEHGYIYYHNVYTNFKKDKLKILMIEIYLELDILEMENMGLVML